MKWHAVRGRVSKTIDGTTRARAYYWTRRDGVRDFKAGYYGFGREIEFYGKTFKTLNEARTYCAQKDADALIIEAV
jgi:hypothetical protein